VVLVCLLRYVVWKVCPSLKVLNILLMKDQFVFNSPIHSCTGDRKILTNPQQTNTSAYYIFSSSSSSGPRAYAPDALQPMGLLCDPCPPVIFRRSHFRCQVPPHPYDARDPSSERWNCGQECWPVILPKC
jgi:hypothetical protein